MKSIFFIVSLLIVCHVEVKSQGANTPGTSVTPSIGNSSDLPPINPSEPPIHCFFDEKFKSEVKIFQIIGVREYDKHFRINKPDEGFDFRWYDPVVQKTTTMAPNKITTMTTEIPSTSATPSQAIVTFNRPLTETFIDGITVSWDPKETRFHFVVPDHAFRRYPISWQEYHQNSAVYGMALNKIRPEVRSHKTSEPYTCHFNYVENSTVCVSIVKNKVTVSVFSTNRRVPFKEYKLILPNYLSFDDFFSYSDMHGTDFILIHHKGQWIYRVDHKQYILNKQMFFKVFHLKTPAGQNHQFDGFMHADEYGLVTKYKYHDINENKTHYRYFYSLFSEVSGLKTYCVHNKYINGSLMIMGIQKTEKDKGIAAALRSRFNLKKREKLEIPTMLRLLFYCATIYFLIFLGTQTVPLRKAHVWRDMRKADREIQRLAPVIESVMARVYVFLENEKKKSGIKEQ